MEHVGIDVHKNQSQICLIPEAGEVLHQRIHTQRERLVAVFAERPKARILLEASTESAWVARCLEALGHEVLVADPNYAPMYAQRSRRVKTDRRDAEALAHACRLGAYRSAHRTSDSQRHVRGGSPYARPRCGAVRGGAVWYAHCCANMALACVVGPRSPLSSAWQNSSCRLISPLRLRPS